MHHKFGFKLSNRNELLWMYCRWILKIKQKHLSTFKRKAFTCQWLGWLAEVWWFGKMKYLSGCHTFRKEWRVERSFRTQSEHFGMNTDLDSSALFPCFTHSCQEVFLEARAGNFYLETLFLSNPTYLINFICHIS